MHKIWLLLLLVPAFAGIAGASALFDSGFNLQIAGPIGFDLTQSFNISVSAGPVVNPPKNIHVGNASASITPIQANLGISPFLLSLNGGVSGNANKPDGHAEAETGGLSYTILFRNILGSDFQNLTFRASGSALLLATADP